MCRMDIAEKRRPQDGRIKTDHQGKEIELRVSTLPTAFGEKVVMRIFDPDVLLRDLSGLGFYEDELKTFNDWIQRPHGIILVTGPTGSGKTVTLYSALKSLASSEINITTIEDPIEMVHEEFNQTSVQANKKAAALDAAYFNGAGKPTAYGMYYIHNLDFIVACMMFEGRSTEAISTEPIEPW